MSEQGKIKEFCLAVICYLNLCSCREKFLESELKIYREEIQRLRKVVEEAISNLDCHFRFIGSDCPHCKLDKALSERARLS